MITQTGYGKIEIKFGCEILLDSVDMPNEDYGTYHRFYLVTISDKPNYDENMLDSLNPDDAIYEIEQADYIRRYQKFVKFLKENEGKQFIGVIPSYVINGSCLKTTGFITVFRNDFYFDRAIGSRGVNAVSFLTDYELIPIDSNNSPIKLRRILESIVISRAYKPLFEHDYQGRSVV